MVSTCTSKDLDAIDGTPVLDIKALVHRDGPRGEIRQAAWSHEMPRDHFFAPTRD
jgi:tRNA (Thr-GGU) A37 N-methylase